MRGASSFGPVRSPLLVGAFLVAAAGPSPGLSAQEPARSGAGDRTLEVDPPALELELGEEARLTARVLDDAGEAVEADLIFFSLNRRALSVTPEGRVEPLRPGEHAIVVLAPGPEGFADDRTLRVDVPVTVAWPPPARVEVDAPEGALYSGTTVRLETRVLTEGGLERTDLDPRFESSDPEVVAVDAYGWVTAGRPGRATVRVEAGEAATEIPLSVAENPVRTVELTADRERARTGDVLHFRAVPRDARGREVADAPVTFALLAHPVDSLLAPPAAAQIDEDGSFVAEKPGVYTVVAASGPASAQKNVKVDGRDVERAALLVGRGTVGHVHTSDLWVWKGADGRDYAVTGTWGGEGKAYFWDVTDPSSPVRIDSVQVDARTVNDVKVSEDGTVCVISREGASDRRNGIVVLDCSDPANVEILSRFDDGLTGGVHNVFIHRGHVYAVNNGRRFDVIDIGDPREPRRVGRFELDTPGHAVHDVWVDDGIAYSSNWGDGVVLVDVGNGIRGGSPSNPVLISSYAYPSGANHAAFPYRDRETGRFYVIAGDEIMPECRDLDAPCQAQGYIHFIDLTDLENPREVARYQVPEAGTHNLWVEGERLYVAYYNGGLRVVDISGELKGDLYRQGREVARFLSWAPDGHVPNAPMAWGPQPHEGHVFFSDFNSGLWVVRVEPETELVP